MDPSGFPYEEEVEGSSPAGPTVAAVEPDTHAVLMWPIVEALRRLGGSARVEEIFEAVVETDSLSGERGQAAQQPDDRSRAAALRIVWACNFLKNIGAVEDGGRGVWSLTERGWAITADEMSSIPPRPTCGA